MNLRCTQCGTLKEDTGWLICGQCSEKNIAYQKSVATVAMALHREFQAHPPGSPLGHKFNRPSEMRGRKARNAVVASYTQEEQE